MDTSKAIYNVKITQIAVEIYKGLRSFLFVLDLNDVTAYKYKKLIEW